VDNCFRPENSNKRGCGQENNLNGCFASPSKHNPCDSYVSKWETIQLWRKYGDNGAVMVNRLATIGVQFDENPLKMHKMETKPLFVTESRRFGVEAVLQGWDRAEIARP